MTAITRALSAALLHFVWQGLGVTILLWVALHLLRRRSAAVRYGVSCCALVLLVALPAATTWMLYEHPAPARPVSVSAAGGWDAGLPAPAAPAQRDWLRRLQNWAVPVWSCGVLLFSLRMMWGWGQIASLRRSGPEADEGLLLVVAALARRMRLTRNVRVVLSKVADSPSVTGWLRPVILLPVAAIAGLTTEQLEAVLAHELAHIRRHDYLVNLLQMVAETLLFYHPAVWWVSARIRQERELCCDDLAVETCGGAICYARALTALEKMRAGRPALALGSTDGPLLLRVRRLVTNGGEYGPSKLSGIIAAGLGVVCLALCVNWAHGQEPAHGFAVTLGSGSVEDGPGVAVDTAGAALIHRSAVEYPGELARKHVGGTVAVEVRLDTAGNVIDGHVLSGPDELRKTALTAVLNWHFGPGTGNTRVVRISFQPPKLEPERVSITTRGANGKPQTNEVLAAAEQEMTDERNRTMLTVNFMQNSVIEARARVERLEKLPHANPQELDQARAELAEAERRQEATKQMAATAEVRNLEMQFRAQNVEDLQKQIEDLRAAGVEPSDSRVQKLTLRLDNLFRGMARQRMTPVGSRLVAIEIRGLSDEAGNDLLSRLPMHEGDTMTAEGIESAGRTIREFDEHLEFNYGPEPEGVVLRIHPAGSAMAPLLRRK